MTRAEFIECVGARLGFPVDFDVPAEIAERIGSMQEAGLSVLEAVGEMRAALGVTA
jgi:hypothetical protein